MVYSNCFYCQRWFAFYFITMLFLGVPWKRPKWDRRNFFANKKFINIVTIRNRRPGSFSGYEEFPFCNPENGHFHSYFLGLPSFRRGTLCCWVFEICARRALPVEQRCTIELKVWASNNVQHIVHPKTLVLHWLMRVPQFAMDCNP